MPRGWPPWSSRGRLFSSDEDKKPTARQRYSGARRRFLHRDARRVVPQVVGRAAAGDDLGSVGGSVEDRASIRLT